LKIAKLIELKLIEKIVFDTFLLLVNI
jgi:hypothetical protein